MEEKQYKKYLIGLVVLVLMTIILSLLSLNRLSGLCNKGNLFFFSDSGIRIMIEHLGTGFYVPLFGLFFFYFGKFLYHLLSGTKITPLLGIIEWRILFWTSVVYFGWELGFQFNYYNSGWFGSISQVIIGTIGIILSWVFYWNIDKDK